MTIEDYEFIIEELQKVIDDAKALVAKFEAENADESMPAEYHKVHALYQRAVKSQKAYTHAMLDLVESEPSVLNQLCRESSPIEKSRQPSMD